MSSERFALQFGKLIRERRLELGITQEALAEAIGITQPSVSAQERGEVIPTGIALLGLLRELKLDVTAVMALTGSGRDDGEAA